jgi:hypothetical protein
MGVEGPQAVNGKAQALLVGCFAPKSERVETNACR